MNLNKIQRGVQALLPNLQKYYGMLDGMEARELSQKVASLLNNVELRHLSQEWSKMQPIERPVPKLTPISPKPKKTPVVEESVDIPILGADDILAVTGEVVPD